MLPEPPFAPLPLDPPHALSRDLDVKIARDDLARPLVLEPAEQLAQDPKARGDDTGSGARVHALPEKLDDEFGWS